jgi:hypothetical protein
MPWARDIAVFNLVRRIPVAEKLGYILYYDQLSISAYLLYSDRPAQAVGVDADSRSPEGTLLLVVEWFQMMEWVEHDR